MKVPLRRRSSRRAGGEPHAPARGPYGPRLAGEVLDVSGASFELVVEVAVVPRGAGAARVTARHLRLGLELLLHQRREPEPRRLRGRAVPAAWGRGGLGRRQALRLAGPVRGALPRHDLDEGGLPLLEAVRERRAAVTRLRSLRLRPHLPELGSRF